MNSVNDAANEFLEAAVEEALDLLNDAIFDQRRSYHAEGSVTGVSVVVNPSAAEVGTVRVQVFCYTAGHLATNWDGLPLVLIDKSSGDERLAFLDARGRAEFILRLVPDTTEFKLEALGPALIMESVSELSVAHFGANPREPLILHAASRDGRLEAKAEEKGEVLDITVTSLNPVLYNSSVHIVLRSPTNAALPVRRTVHLDGAKGGASIRIVDIPADAVLAIFGPRVPRRGL